MQKDKLMSVDNAKKVAVQDRSINMAQSEHSADSQKEEEILTVVEVDDSERTLL